MPQDLEQSIIRIFNQDGKTVGTAFLVDTCLAVTCAHVVAAAGSRPGGLLSVQFHADAQQQRITALVLADAWSPAEADDVAFLKLQSTPDGARPVQLASARHSIGQRYYTFGFPNSGSTDGRPATAIIDGLAPFSGKQEHLQIEGDKITYGMSGAPVLDLDLKRVVGMLTGGRDDEYTRFAYAATSDTLQKYRPELILTDAGAPALTPEQRGNVREHLKWGLRAEQKNLLDGFLDEYLGDREAVPFGGREADLAELDAWLNDPDGLPYRLLTAPAGRGKTHLVVQWAAKLITQPAADLRVILAPVSIRFGTAAPESHLQLLARALAQYYHDPIQDTAGETRAFWRSICADYLGRAHPEQQTKLVVILDGLDESTEADPDQWRALMGDLPAGTRVLLSARQLGDEQDGSGWLERLGLKPGRAAQQALPPLDAAGLRQVLGSLGNPLQGYAQENEIVSELLRLTQGDPLLVRLYVLDLHARLQPAAQPVDARGVLAQLKAAKPDLKGYFERWWKDQRKQWKAQGEPVYQIEDELRDFLRLLAASVAPLNGDEIGELLGGDFTHEWKQKRVAERAPRIIIGASQSGYTLSHPRFGVCFYEEMSEKERAAVEARFLAAGQRTLDGLQAGTLQPKDTQPYFIFHTKDHLLRALKTGQAQPPALYALLCEGWLRAHEYHSGTPASFLEDVDAAWETAGKQPNGDPEVQVLALLCFSSVATLSSKIPVEFIVQSHRLGGLSRAQALAFLRQNTDLKQKAIGLVCLSEVQTGFNDQTALRQEALETARQIEGVYFRSRALAEIVPHLPTEQALETARQIEEASYCASALAEIVPHLPAEQALETARQIKSAAHRASALAKIAPQLPLKQQPVIYLEALITARRIEDIYDRASALVEIADRLPVEQKPAVYQEALETARQIEHADNRVYALATIAPHLPLEQALETARQIERADYRTYTLAEIAPQFPLELQPALCQEVLRTARQIKDVYFRAEALAEIAPQFPLEQALEMTCQIEDASYRARALAEIAPHLPLEQALEMTRQIEDDYSRARALAEIAPQLPVEQALEMMRQIEYINLYIRALAKIAPQLPLEQQPALYQEALETARQINRANHRASALAEIAPQLPLEQQPALYLEILETMRQIEDAPSRIRVLADIAPQLPFEQAMEIVHQIEYIYIRILVLTQIAPQLPLEQQLALYLEALEIARQTEHASSFDGALAAFVPQLSLEQHLSLYQKALETARLIENASSRALAEIAPQLPLEQRLALCQEALEMARLIEDASSRADALAEIALQLPLERQSAFYQEALKTARQIEDASSRTSAIAKIASKFPLEQQLALYREALETARLIEEVDDRTRSLARIAPHLPLEQQPALYQEILETARLIERADHRVPTLAEIAPHLPLEQALEIAHQIEYTDDGVRALSEIASQLPLEQQVALYKEILERARQIRPASSRARALAAIAPQFPLDQQPALYQETLETMRQIQDSDSRASALAGIADRVPGASLPQLWEVALKSGGADLYQPLAERWSELCVAAGVSSQAAFTRTLRNFTSAEREDVFKLVTDMTPVIEQLGGKAALVKTVEAIQAVSRWWP